MIKGRLVVREKVVTLFVAFFEEIKKTATHGSGGCHACGGWNRLLFVNGKDMGRICERCGYVRVYDPRDPYSSEAHIYGGPGELAPDWLDWAAVTVDNP